MRTITLSAVYDGEHILLEDDYPLPKNARLLVTLVDPGFDAGIEGEADFRRDWTRMALQSLARTYDDGEPDYPDAKLIERNPLYEER